MIRVAIVGAGAIANAHADALATSPHFSLVAVVDVDAARASALAEKFGARSATSLDTVTDGSVDAAIVSTPPNTHRAVTVALLEAGIHVLCEKPFAIRRDDAYAMAETAKRCGRVLTVATKFRFVNDLTIAREAIAAGKIGTPYYIQNVFASPVDMTGRWNLDPQSSGGGVIIDNGTHSVDIMRYLLGPIESVRAVESFNERVYSEVEDTARLEFLSVGGVFARIDLSWSEHSASPWFVAICGSQGDINIGWKGSRWRFNGAPEHTPFGVGYDKKAALAGQAADFAAAICGERPPTTSLDEAVASVDVIDAAYASMRVKSWIAVGGVTMNQPASLHVVA
jgi:predicted dehydrogenase